MEPMIKVIELQKDFLHAEHKRDTALNLDDSETWNEVVGIIKIRLANAIRELNN